MAQYVFLLISIFLDRALIVFENKITATVRIKITTTALVYLKNVDEITQDEWLTLIGIQVSWTTCLSP